MEMRFFGGGGFIVVVIGSLQGGDYGNSQKRLGTIWLHMSLEFCAIYEFIGVASYFVRYSSSSPSIFSSPHMTSWWTWVILLRYSVLETPLVTKCLSYCHSYYIIIYITYAISTFDASIADDNYTFVQIKLYGTDFVKLQEYIEPQYLPDYLGGTAGDMETASIKYGEELIQWKEESTTTRL